MLRVPSVTRYIARNTRSSSLTRAFSQHRPSEDPHPTVRTRSEAPTYRAPRTTRRADLARGDSEMEERAHAQADRGRKGRGRGGGGGGGMSREVRVSKALSRLLRHQAASAGIKLDEAGFAELDKVVSPHVSLAPYREVANNPPPAGVATPPQPQHHFHRHPDRRQRQR